MEKGHVSQLIEKQFILTQSPTQSQSSTSRKSVTQSLSPHTECTQPPPKKSIPFIYGLSRYPQEAN
jgi:hypothetical protein